MPEQINDDKSFDDTLEEGGIASDDTKKNDDHTKADSRVDELEGTVKKLESQINNSDNEELARIKVANAELTTNFAKATAFMEGAGVAKFDKETGQIIKTMQETATDPLQEKVSAIKDKIDTEKMKLNKLREDGEITGEDYYSKMQKDITPLEDSLREVRLDIRDNKLKESFSTKKDQEKLDKKTDLLDNKKTSIADKYNQLANDYPDISDNKSDLFKKMQEIYALNPNNYKKVNFDDGNGNPKEYRALIIEAEKEIVRNNFSTPRGKGERNTPSKSHINKEDVQMLVNQGFTDKSVISDINSKMSGFNINRTIVMDDLS